MSPPSSVCSPKSCTTALLSRAGRRSQSVEPHTYYIETDNFFPFKGAGWYDADLVFYAYECKLIRKKNILLQYKSSTVLDIDNFKTFIKEVYNLFHNPKYAINTLIGIFGHNYK